WTGAKRRCGRWRESATADCAPMKPSPCPLPQAGEGSYHQPAVDGDEAEEDQRHAGERDPVRALAEDDPAEEQRADRDEEGDEQEIGRPRRRQDAELDDIGERRAEEREGPDRFPDD